MVPEPEHCPNCGASFDPAALDDVIFHATAECTKPGGEAPRTGIRGVERKLDSGH